MCSICVGGNSKGGRKQVKTPEEIKKALECCGMIDDDGCCKCPYNGGACDFQLERDTLEYIQTLEDHIRAVTNMVPEWVSMKERLPENLEKCLTYSKANGFKIGCYTEVGFIMTGYCEDPTHWIPLPKPPEEG